MDKAATRGVARAAGRRWIPLGCALGFLLCGCAEPLDRFVVGIDLYHGGSWPSIVQDMESWGLRTRELRTPKDFERISGIGVLVICTKGAESSIPFTPAEIKGIARFVGRGGGLLCADQSWSWTMKEHGNRPLEDFPLNVLGRELGFEILDHSVLAPRNLSPELLGGVGEVSRSSWWPSEIRATGKNARTLISDQNQRSMAAAMDYGNGRVAVVGHPDLLSENPFIVRNLILYLSGLDAMR